MDNNHEEFRPKISKERRKEILESLEKKHKERDKRNSQKSFKSTERKPVTKNLELTEPIDYGILMEKLRNRITSQKNIEYPNNDFHNNKGKFIDNETYENIQDNESIDYDQYAKRMKRFISEQHNFNQANIAQKPSDKTPAESENVFEITASFYNPNKPHNAIDHKTTISNEQCSNISNSVRNRSSNQCISLQSSNKLMPKDSIYNTGIHEQLSHKFNFPNSERNTNKSYNIAKEGPEKCGGCYRTNNKKDENLLNYVKDVSVKPSKKYLDEYNNKSSILKSSERFNKIKPMPTYKDYIEFSREGKEEIQSCPDSNNINTKYKKIEDLKSIYLDKLIEEESNNSIIKSKVSYKCDVPCEKYKSDKQYERKDLTKATSVYKNLESENKNSIQFYDEVLKQARSNIEKQRINSIRRLEKNLHPKVDYFTPIPLRNRMKSNFSKKPVPSCEVQGIASKKGHHMKTNTAEVRCKDLMSLVKKKEREMKLSKNRNTKSTVDINIKDSKDVEKFARFNEKKYSQTKTKRTNQYEAKLSNIQTKRRNIKHVESCVNFGVPKEYIIGLDNY